MPAMFCNEQATMATINDHPYQSCCHRGIQFRSFPRAPKVITLIAMKIPATKLSAPVPKINLEETLANSFLN